jgi:pimeloyl-ACP methyl ester carboxylesterase
MELDVRLKLGRQTLTAHVWRGGTGSPLVLVQGGMADAELHWSRVWDALSRDFDVVAPDLPGLGASDALRNPDWRTLAAWLGALLDVLGVARAAVVGNSFGGTMARCFSALARERTTHLVCVDGGQFIELPFWQRVFLRTPPGASAWLTRGRAGFSREGIRSLFADPNRLDELSLARCLSGIDPLLAMLRGCVTGPAPKEMPRCPALIVWGAEDRRSPVSRGEALKGQLGARELCVIAGAGHLPQFDQPDAFVLQLRRFLASA